MSFTGLVRRITAALDDTPDRDLLARFAATRDEAAFTTLVHRHGPLVLGVCRRALRNEADADDAFQATFLVLARRGSKLDPAQPLGPWLYRVAVLTARTVRRGNARRFARLEKPPANLAAPAPDAATDLRLDLDRALLALPEKYRTPLVMCHLQGWSRREAAACLGCREGTLSSLLARGLVKLKNRLRGYDPTVALAAGAAPIPLALAAATARAAAGIGRSPAAVRLADGFLRGYWVSKLATAAGLVAVLVAAGYGVTASARPHASPITAPIAEREPAPPSPERHPVTVRHRIDVCVGGPLGGVPLRAVQVGPNGPLGEPEYFTGIDRFQHYLAAARTAGPAPPGVRVDVWDGVHPDRTRAVFRACRGAGYTSVKVRGRVPTLNPGGWREFDDATVDLGDLVPPAQANGGGGGGKAGGGCTIRPIPCRTPAMEP
jgi:RNA polymerase sigma factor (sigma-70 family)